MKVIIAGSRTITDMGILEAAINQAINQLNFEITEVVCGMARGVDELGYIWAKDNNIPVKEFPANWDKFGKSAGYKRNVQMAEYGEVLIAIRENNSRGTSHMIDIANRLGLKVFIMDI